MVFKYGKLHHLLSNLFTFLPTTKLPSLDVSRTNSKMS